MELEKLSSQVEDLLAIVAAQGMAIRLLLQDAPVARANATAQTLLAPQRLALGKMTDRQVALVRGTLRALTNPAPEQPE